MGPINLPALQQPVAKPDEPAGIEGFLKNLFSPSGAPGQPVFGGNPPGVRLPNVVGATYGLGPEFPFFGQNYGVNTFHNFPAAQQPQSRFPAMPGGVNNDFRGYGRGFPLFWGGGNAGGMGGMASAFGGAGENAPSVGGPDNEPEI
jgi:hypothetical protein